MLARIFNTITVAAVLTVTPMLAAQSQDNQAMQHEDSMKKVHAQEVCPISGKPINKDVYVDHDGKRVYLCCPGCKDKAEADAAEIINKLEAQNVKLEAVSKKQTQCPVMGGEIDKSLYSVYDGNKVYFCCPMCKPKFEKEPAKYLEKMKEQGIEPEKVEKNG